MAKTYDSYKDSGIAWIGEIPSEWKVSRYKFYTTNRMGETILASDTTDVGIPIYSATQDDSIFGYIQNPKVILKKGDIVIPARGNSIGYATQIKDEIATCSQTTICSTNIHGINSRFLFYCIYGLKDDWFRYDGSAIPQITVDQVKNNVLPLPSKQEQHSIASFLDTKCGEIDSLISLQEEMISELQAYKQSVITEAVTKGLDPNAKMNCCASREKNDACISSSETQPAIERKFKDSGIAWIGEIPSEWKVEILSMHLYEHRLYNTELKETNLLSLSYGNIVKKNIDTKEGLLPESFNHYNIIDEGDIVLRLTDLQNDKRSLRTGLCKEHGIITSAYLTLRNRGNDNSDYLHYLLHAYDLCKVFYGMGNGVRQGMNFSDMRKLELIIPPLSEQQSIATYLDAKTSQIDSLISLKQQKIDELKSYKKSIIYEYVTGKKRV